MQSQQFPFHLGPSSTISIFLFGQILAQIPQAVQNSLVLKFLSLFLKTSFQSLYKSKLILVCFSFKSLDSLFYIERVKFSILNLFELITFFASSPTLGFLPILI